MTSKEILDGLDKVVPNAVCELNYNKDYELLMAVVLSAQCTDARVNMVTKELFSKYDIYGISNASIKEIESVIYPVGTYHRKAIYLNSIATSLIKDYDGKVPNNREYLESLPGVGRKSCNVVLSNIYNIPAIAVDTHVTRVSKRLGIAKDNDEVSVIEKKLMKKFPKDRWIRLHHQLVLFGRYICKSQKPDCSNCPFINSCKYNKTRI